MWDRFSNNLGLVGFLPVWSVVFFGVRLGFLQGLLNFI